MFASCSNFNINQYAFSMTLQANEVLLKVWKLVSSLECVLGLGLKSHKLVTVAMGKIRTRVSFWDIVEESSASNGTSVLTLTLPPLNVADFSFHLTLLQVLSLTRSRRCSCKCHDVNPRTPV